MAMMIEVEGLTKLYRERAAVNALSFELKAGEVLGFLGPNGAGKTTTMRMLTGFLPPTSGTARVAGFDVFESPLEVKRRIGYLPEQPPVYLDMTVRDYLAFCARIKGVHRREMRREIERALVAARVADVQERLIGNLSKGYRQRVGLAQAILGSPPVLILDEPTVGLDPVQIIEVRSLIRDLASSGQHTIILSTHILSEVTELCQKVLILKSGEKLAFDTIEGLRQQILEGRQASLEELYLRLIEGKASVASADGDATAPTDARMTGQVTASPAIDAPKAVDQKPSPAQPRATSAAPEPDPAPAPKNGPDVRTDADRVSDVQADATAQGDARHAASAVESDAIEATTDADKGAPTDNRAQAAD